MSLLVRIASRQVIGHFIQNLSGGITPGGIADISNPAIPGTNEPPGGILYAEFLPSGDPPPVQSSAETSSSISYYKNVPGHADSALNFGLIQGRYQRSWTSQRTKYTIAGRDALTYGVDADGPYHQLEYITNFITGNSPQNWNIDSGITGASHSRVYWRNKIKIVDSYGDGVMEANAAGHKFWNYMDFGKGKTVTHMAEEQSGLSSLPGQTNSNIKAVNNFEFIIRGSSDGSGIFRNVPGLPSVRLAQNLNLSKRLTVGQVCDVEGYDICSDIDQFNGEFHLWADGTKVSQYTDVRTRTAAAPKLFTGYLCDPIHGGGGTGNLIRSIFVRYYYTKIVVWL